MKDEAIRWEIGQVLQWIAAKKIRLQPDYQRLYIWPPNKEQAFIDTILRGFPIPPIWVWRHAGPSGKTILEVIDGQQRLTCILKFIDNQFVYKQPELQSEREENLSRYDGRYYDAAPKGSTAKSLPVALQGKLIDYTFPVIVISTDDRDLVIDIFKRLNKSATNLTPQELRNAFYNGKFKSSVYATTARLQDSMFWGGKDAVFRKPRTDRMKNQQFVSDLYVLLMEDANQEKSERLDYYYEAYDRKFSNQNVVEKKFERTIKMIKRLVPGTSRFTKWQADFYSLFLLTHRLIEAGLLSVSDRESIMIARDAIRQFETQYAQYFSSKGRKKERNVLFEQYRETIVGRQREKETREQRFQIISDLVRPGLNRKQRDGQRLFNEMQKLFIWQAQEDKTCGECGYEVKTYAEYEPDHIEPWINGGRTELSNGRIVHSHCNKSKGARKNKTVRTKAASRRVAKKRGTRRKTVV